MTPASHHQTETFARITTLLREGAEMRLSLIETSLPDIAAAADAMEACFVRGGKLLLCGNGGSAADAQHIAAEFVGRFERERAALPALALTTDTSALTAIGNDYSYEMVFARQVRAHGRAGDILIAISTSGTSKSVLLAVEAARELGMTVIGLTGKDGGTLRGASDISLHVPYANTARVQECHLAIEHILCDLVESRLFPSA